MTAPDPRNVRDNVAAPQLSMQVGPRLTSQLTHVTEVGLMACAGRLFPRGASRTRAAIRARARRLGLCLDVVACDSSPAGGRYASDVIMSVFTAHQMPTCPRCAVLRDMALSGVLPERAP